MLALVAQCRVVESNVASPTYLIRINHDLPVISINSNPANFWDDQIGIYVDGTNSLISFCSSIPKNYWQEWERLRYHDDVFG